MKPKEAFFIGFLALLVILGLVILGVLAKRENDKQSALDAKQRALDDKYQSDVNVLSNAVKNYIPHVLPNTFPMPNFDADAPIGKPVIWSIGRPFNDNDNDSKLLLLEGLSGISTNHVPSFEEYGSFVMVLGQTVEERKYDYLIHKRTFVEDDTANSTDGSADGPDIQRGFKIGSEDLKAWVVDLKSNKIVAYREFQPIPLSSSFSAENDPEGIQIKKFYKWIDSLENLAQKPKEGKNEVQKIPLGAFTISIPSEWTPYIGDEKEAFVRTFQAQSKEIYQRYSGVAEPGNTSDLIVFHTQDGGTFSACIYKLPAQADLMGDLIKEAPEKAKWGIEHGFIKSASPVTPLARDGFDGFYLETEENDGSHSFVGGLELSSRKTEVIQLTFTAVKGETAPATFQKVLASVRQ